MMETFNNFKELMEYDSELAQELLKEKGEVGGKKKKSTTT